MFPTCPLNSNKINYLERISARLNIMFTSKMYMHKLSTCTSEDIQEICKFWSRNNYLEGINLISLKSHLLWKYNLKFTQLWILKKKGQIIGSCGRIKTRLLFHGKFVCNGPWGIDSLVEGSLDKQERRSVFLRVFRSALLEGYRKKESEVVLCFPNEVVKDAYLRMGWLDIPIFFKYSKDIETCFYKTNDLKFSLIQKFDYRWNRIWNTISKKFSISALRDHSYLNWRYFQNSNKKYIVLLIKSKNQIRGYLVLKEKEVLGRKVGCIVDFLIEPSEDFVNKAISFLSQRGCRSIEAHVSYKCYRDIFLKLGFQEQKVDFFIFTRFPELLGKLLKKCDDWFITSGDGDFEMES